MTEVNMFELAQWLEQYPSTADVLLSIPSSDRIFLFFLYHILFDIIFNDAKSCKVNGISSDTNVSRFYGNSL